MSLFARYYMYLTALTCVAALGAATELAEVRAVFVRSSGPEGVKVREMLQEGKTCLELATNESKADAILELTGESVQGTSGSVLPSRKSEVTGVLSTPSGDYLWSRSERFEDAIMMNGRKVAAQLVVKRLAKDVGCKGKARR